MIAKAGRESITWGVMAGGWPSLALGPIVNVRRCERRQMSNDGFLEWAFSRLT